MPIFIFSLPYLCFHKYVASKSHVRIDHLAPELVLLSDRPHMSGNNWNDKRISCKYPESKVFARHLLLGIGLILGQDDLHA